MLIKFIGQEKIEQTILDFGFWILDWGREGSQWWWITDQSLIPLIIQNPKSKI